MTDVSLGIEPFDYAALKPLIDAGDVYYAALYPAVSNHTLDPSALADPNVSVIVARRNGEAVAMGVVVDQGDYAELKRMFVAETARGLGLGRDVLRALEAHSRAALGHTCIRLETGIAQPEALGLYESAGYAKRGPFADYPDDPLSIFYEKTL